MSSIVSNDFRIHQLIKKRDEAIDAKAHFEAYNGNDDFRAAKNRAELQSIENGIKTYEAELMALARVRYPDEYVEDDVQTTIANIKDNVELPQPQQPHWSLNPGRG